MSNDKHITFFKDTIIYIQCPANMATGGPEALHQLGHHLNLLGFKAVMFYFYQTPGLSPVNPLYEQYGVPYVNDIEDKHTHIMLMPETHLLPLFDKQLQNIRKVIWWLSVTNYNITLANHINTVRHKNFFKLRLAVGHFNIPTIKYLRRKKLSHIRHSFFSENFLLDNGIKPVGKISDYMNSAFFKWVNEDAEKEDIVIYNPAKNDMFLEQIIEQMPELNWKPIKNMLPHEVAFWMNKSKLYVDFGFHPGKERMPREACIMRCCLIVGRVGSAAFTEDMPIPDDYRFNKSKHELPAIIKQIKYCLNNYDTAISHFSAYREELYQEERIFINDIKTIFRQDGQIVK